MCRGRAVLYRSSIRSIEHLAGARTATVLLIATPPSIPPPPPARTYPVIRTVTPWKWPLLMTHTSPTSLADWYAYILHWAIILLNYCAIFWWFTFPHLFLFLMKVNETCIKSMYTHIWSMHCSLLHPYMICLIIYGTNQCYCMNYICLFLYIYANQSNSTCARLLILPCGCLFVNGQGENCSPSHIISVFKYSCHNHHMLMMCWKNPFRLPRATAHSRCIIIVCV
jgi:hypothetical protein